MLLIGRESLFSQLRVGSRRLQFGYFNGVLEGRLRLLVFIKQPADTLLGEEESSKACGQPEYARQKDHRGAVC